MKLSRRALIAAIPIGTTWARADARDRRQRVDIREHGAAGDGKTVNTRAIQHAIDACATEGGGTVIVPRGTFVSGSIVLKPGVDLELRAGGVLRASPNVDDFPIVMRRFAEAYPEPLPMALVNATGHSGLRITGPGMLDGHAEMHWRDFFRQRERKFEGIIVQYQLPQLCFLQDCKDVLVSGVVFRDSPFWNLHLYRCRDVVVEDSRFEVPHKLRAPSSDGTDIDSCQDVTIRRCYYSVDDDCIVLKGTQGAGALAYVDAPPCERIHVHDCEFDKGLGAVSFGSNATTVRNVRVERCVVRDMPAIRFKIRPDTPGQRYENIFVRKIQMQPVPPGRWHGNEVFAGMRPGAKIGADEPQMGMIVNARLIHGSDVPAKMPGAVIRNVVIEDVTGTTKGFGDISGNATTRIEDITLRRIGVTLTDEAHAALVARGVQRLTIDAVKVNGAAVKVVR